MIITLLLTLLTTEPFNSIKPHQRAQLFVEQYSICAAYSWAISDIARELNEIEKVNEYYKMTDTLWGIAIEHGNIIYPANESDSIVTEKIKRHLFKMVPNIDNDFAKKAIPAADDKKYVSLLIIEHDNKCKDAFYKPKLFESRVLNNAYKSK